MKDFLYKSHNLCTVCYNKWEKKNALYTYDGTGLILLMCAAGPSIYKSNQSEISTRIKPTVFYNMLKVKPRLCV